jgi:tRNA threonylcarbamoyladenosine biosynthesis protein TsaB
MIDARRMEVYTSVFTPDGKQITETEPKVIDPESFCKELQEGPVLFIGDGAAKCSEILKSGNAFSATAIRKPLRC